MYNVHATTFLHYIKSEIIYKLKEKADLQLQHLLDSNKISLSLFVEFLFDQCYVHTKAGALPS